ncbi:endo-1,4-beta-xylanase [Brevundimonas sp.]|uniref:endo-1,4-beta-xylanase n=1 Tax=Brevundimonas sp. TaxID=1871086 RepID=UPI003D6D5AAF
MGVPGLTEARTGMDAAKSRRALGPYLGAAVRIDQIEADPRLAEAVLRDCASLTPEIDMKWDALQPGPGDWRTGLADGLVAFARRHGLAVRGHTLLWDQSTPAWARARLERNPGDWKIVADYFETVLSRYGAAVSEWDVVNEPIDTQARDNLRATVFKKAYGPTYIERALHEARAHAPNARLVINDYGFDYDNPVEHERRAAFLRLLEQLKSSGAPLDGVGVQAHLDLSKGPLKREILAPFFTRIADLGLTIAITELDVKEETLRGDVAERDQRVADHVQAYLDIALEQKSVTGLTTWGLSDRHSWLQKQPVRPSANPAGMNRGLPYDGALEPKPVYWAIQQAMSGAKAPTTLTTR